ncbi:hypothetical protein BMW23_1220 [Bodo saltans virus]|uniref:Uncharacterized protein n=1 Tax=Bodo saltans virus TaxID=2024608 RepID=A0A2H4UWE6_9VIRU|nr:hypothetical protein QJ851_gp1200 [Bodo saltans virus]ATZ81263.1 hypothetical protein BMW23_1220 [Bodo saltans virus]
MKPICATCNLSMKTQNMEEFKREFFPQKKQVNLKNVFSQSSMNI